MSGEIDSRMWQGPQPWVRDRHEPCVALGAAGQFDDMHIFAPCVALENGVFNMWYCGSRGTVAGRIFRLGLATSADGVHFDRHEAAPVLSFGADSTRSVLTATLLRSPDGAVCREDGQLRMWFSSCDFPAGDGLHTLHEATSIDGITWSAPSEPLLEHVYAPTVIRRPDGYRMWFTSVASDPWSIRHARSVDGRDWEVTPEPALTLAEQWEHQRLFYPTVLCADGLYLMWYGSYSAHGAADMKTALGFAFSEDGLSWSRHPSNPVFGPHERNDWESHYTTSQSVLRLPDGSWRMWYASRPKPPFEHKYFAIGTAAMKGSQ